MGTRLTDRGTVIVTGGSRGIGAATARALASDGYRVCVNFRANEEAATAVVSDLIRSGAKSLAVQADVSVEADVLHLFETAENVLGPIRALVNNAAILLPQTRLENMDAARINRILATNVTGSFLCAREAVRRMSTRHGGQGGAIVNVSSVAARTGSPGEYIDYAASKGVIDSLTRGLAREAGGDGIRVNGVRPGFIYTDMHADGGEPKRVDRLAPSIPLKRGGTAEDVAGTIRWLLSEDANYVTGVLIDIAGGR